VPGAHQALAFEPVEWGPAVAAGFTGRLAGVSGPPYDAGNLATHVGDDPRSVEANRAALAAQLGARRIAFMRQVHGAAVAVVGRADGGEPTADALVTAERGVALAVLVADCVPVLLADAAAGVVAAVHAGRQGVAQDVVARAVAAMRSLGARPERTRAALGPAICGRCYPLGEPARSDVLAVAPEAAATASGGEPSVDLRAGLVARLAALGVTAEVVGPCTAESGDHFSYRRDAVTGRTAGLVMLR
jgi:hypothetical protein